MTILYATGVVGTDIYYKETNSHDYLNYLSHHPTHTKNNIVFGLAKKIVEFVSSYETEELRLKQLEGYLIACDYPPQVFKKGIHNARLQGCALLHGGALAQGGTALFSVATILCMVALFFKTALVLKAAGVCNEYTTQVCSSACQH